MILSREQILAAADKAKFGVQEVPIPEWGGSVLVREFDVDERDAYEEFIESNRAKGHFGAGLRAKLIALTVVGENREPIFTEADLPALGALPHSSANKIFKAAISLNKLSKEEQDKTEKN